MLITKELLSNELLNETLSLSKLMVLRCKIFEIKMQMNVQKEVASIYNDDNTLVQTTQEYEFVVRNLNLVDTAIQIRYEGIHQVGKFHNNCLN